jgi:hypothetical protein
MQWSPNFFLTFFLLLGTGNFLFSILCCSQCGNDPHEDLAKFGYKLNMKVNFVKHPSIVLATYLNHV